MGDTESRLAGEKIFSAAGFARDSSGVYHAKQNALQQLGGFNDFYDTVFDYATSMASDKFQFSSGGVEYMFWAWKGDYLNLGAGAELGIYSNKSGILGMVDVSTPNKNHWLVDTSLAMHMTLTLQHKGETVFSWDPRNDSNFSWDKTWWATGFNPYFQNINACDLTANYTVTFNTKTMYDDFYKTWGGATDPKWKWTFDPKTITATLTF